MNITELYEPLRSGQKVTREIWEEKYIWLMPEAEVPADWCKEPHLKQLAEENGGVMICAAAFRMKDENDVVTTGYQMNADDFFADDWRIYSL